MKNLVQVFLILTGLQSCSTFTFTVKNDEVVSFKRFVPNGIFVNDTLICDQSELTVLDYREYMSWIGQTYGFNSYTYAMTLPDTMVGYNFFKKNHAGDDSIVYSEVPLTESYFNNPAYNEFPMIGITYEQAISYSNWRSDITLQMMLLNSKLIKLHIMPDSSTCFTASRYLAGQYYNYKPPKNLLIPKFRLPSIEEWELCSKHKNGDDWGIDSTTRSLKKYKQYGGNLFLTKELFTLVQQRKVQLEEPNYKDRTPYCVDVRSLFQDTNQLYNLIGNVAEMTSTKGVAKGGSWFHALSESKIKSSIIYKEPEAWLGCRNVCTWVKPN